MSAAEKLLLIWQAVNDQSSPLSNTIPANKLPDNGMSSHAKSRGDLQLTSNSNLGQRNFPNPGIKLWNQTELSLRSKITKHAAKQAIKTFVNTLPLL